MKTKKHLAAVFGTVLALLFILASCSSPKISAVSCPEFPDARYAGDFGNHARKKNAAMTVRNSTEAISRRAGLSRKNQNKKLHREKEYNANETVRVTGTDRIESISRSEYSEALTASTDNTFSSNPIGSSGINLHPKEGSKGNIMVSGFDQDAGCDTIILKSGSRIIGRVEEIGQSEIRYRRCDNITGPIISLAKSGVNRILYVNGTHEVMVSDSPIVVSNVNVKPVYNNTPIKTEPLAIAGFIGALVGLFIAGILLGTTGVVFGAISLGKIKREPARFKGKGLAIASIIIGIIAAVGAIIVVSTM